MVFPGFGDMTNRGNSGTEIRKEIWKTDEMGV
jgi:hypothetical protein